MASKPALMLLCVYESTVQSICHSHRDLGYCGYSGVLESLEAIDDFFGSV